MPQAAEQCKAGNTFIAGWSGAVETGKVNTFALGVLCPDDGHCSRRFDRLILNKAGDVYVPQHKVVKPKIQTAEVDFATSEFAVQNTEQEPLDTPSSTVLTDEIAAGSPEHLQAENEMYEHVAQEVEFLPTERPVQANMRSVDVMEEPKPKGRRGKKVSADA
jgi:hypothetical protein